MDHVEAAVDRRADDGPLEDPRIRSGLVEVQVVGMREIAFPDVDLEVVDLIPIPGIVDGRLFHPHADVAADREARGDPPVVVDEPDPRAGHLRRGAGAGERRRDRVRLERRGAVAPGVQHAVVGGAARSVVEADRALEHAGVRPRLGQCQILLVLAVDGLEMNGHRLRQVGIGVGRRSGRKRASAPGLEKPARRKATIQPTPSNGIST